MWKVVSYMGDKVEDCLYFSLCETLKQSKSHIYASEMPMGPKGPKPSFACNSLQWPIYIINSVDKTKLSCYTPPPTQHLRIFTTLNSGWFTLLTQLIKPNYFVILPHRRSTTVSSETNPLNAASEFSLETRSTIVSLETYPFSHLFACAIFWVEDSREYLCLSFVHYAYLITSIGQNLKERVL